LRRYIVFFPLYGALRILPSFPTRRSSDLYSPSTSLRTVISNMLESGLAEFWMHGGVLHMSLIGEWDRRYRQAVTPLPYIRDLTRSEEHTSELQSRFDLVCRLLLEKKKQIM